MKHSLIATILLSLFTLSIYQNCSPAHNAGESVEEPFDISKVYPYYTEKPEYMSNVQLTKVYLEEGVWRYRFVAAIVHTDSPESDINVSIEILDQDDKLLCLRKQATVNASSNHIQIDNCNSSKKTPLVKILVYAKLATQPMFSKEPTTTYLFPIESLQE